MRTAAHEASAGRRTIGGAFSGDGATIYYGSAEFSVSKVGTGQYTVRFRFPFRSPPSVTASIGQSTSGDVSVTNPQFDSFSVYTFTAAGAASDTTVVFTASGIPR
jgi:hypothetical protein